MKILKSNILIATTNTTVRCALFNSLNKMSNEQIASELKINDVDERLNKFYSEPKQENKDEFERVFELLTND